MVDSLTITDTITFMRKIAPIKVAHTHKEKRI